MKEGFTFILVVIRKVTFKNFGVGGGGVGGAGGVLKRHYSLLQW